MKVIQAFNIDVAALSEKSSQSDYWDKSYDFFMEVKGKDVSELTPKQTDWLKKIEKGLE